MPTLPVEGISSLPGNQFDEAIINPIVYDEPSYDDNALEKAEVLPACSIATAMRMKLELVAQKQVMLNSNTYCLHMSMITFYMVMAICLVILQIRTKIPHI
jgi:hypothetical protein